MLMPKEINCSNFIGLFGYLYKHHGEEGVWRVLDGLVDNEIFLIADKQDPSKLIQVQQHHLVDSAYWVSNEFSLALFANAKKVIGGSRSLIQAGEEAAIAHFSKTSIFVSRICSIKFVCKQAAKINARFNKTKEVRLVEISDSSATFELHYRPKLRLTKDICCWNLGIYTGIAKITGAQDVKCEEIECLVDNDAHCTFHITWKKKPSLFKRFLRWMLKIVSANLLTDYEAAVNERDQLIDSLSRSEEKYRTFIDNAPIAMYTVDTHGNFTYGNKKLLEITGYNREDWLNKPFHPIVYPDDLDMVMKKVVDRLAGKGTTDPYEIRIFNSSKEIMWVKINSQSIYDIDAIGTPNLVGMQSFIEDITDKKLAEEALKESEAKFSSLFELSPQAIALSDLETGKLVDVNAKFCELAQYAKEEMLLLNSIEAGFFTTDSRERFVNELQASEEINGLEMNFKVRDGSILNVLVFSRLIRIAKRTFILTICVDVTDRKRLETQLQQARKMEALGLMAGGIAHDLNNILSGIVSYPDLILMDLAQDSPLRRPITKMKESGQRAADIVSDLLTVARGVATNKDVLNLNSIITEYFSSVEHKKIEKMNPLIRFETHLGIDLLNIRCSATHLKKCLLNLVFNAVEAIKASGHVIVSTQNCYLDKPLTGYQNVRQGEYAILSVSDTGLGILQNDLERIFEPFYTKKTMGRRGTGLGLAVVWNTVEDHGGYLNVKSSLQGTIFELYFPITRDELTAEQAFVPLEDYVGHGETILVVDDEANQREIACILLNKLGYRAKSVSSGEKAVHFLKSHKTDLVILDMIMDPNINGRETYERIIKIKPDQKAIITSGFSETDDVKKTIDLGAGSYIKKPYTLEKIGLAVKNELAR
jgi:PAS domain S-box-containing protein